MGFGSIRKMTYKRLAAMALALLCLTSCVSMLEREATYTAPHVEKPPSSLADTYRVNTYAGLLSSLRSYVEEGKAEGNLRFPATYPGNLTVDLEKAKRQMMEEEPLGCYVLSDITFHINRIIAYYEVTAAFDYRIPPAEYMALETVESAEALSGKMETALRDLGSGFTVLLDVPGEDSAEECVASALELAYGRCVDAVSRPELELMLYPKTSRRAVAKVKLTYSESTTVLRLRQRNMCQAAERLARELAALDEEGLYEAVMARWQLDPAGASGGDAALLGGAANREGLDRGFALVRQYWTEYQTEENEERGDTP